MYWTNEYDLVNIERFIKYVREAEAPHKEDIVTHDTKNFDNVNKKFDVDLLARDFKSFFEQYDNRRQKSFIKTFPNLKDWYLSL